MALRDNVSEYIRGTKGYTDCARSVHLNDGTLVAETANPESLH